ncbi:MAG: isochorismatase family protein [Bdellovibrionaceae bacterium]|nr:isochorismatase family protein [Pseudobdellovibrionaceae bacterium]
MSIFQQPKSKRAIWDADDCALILIDYQPEMFCSVRSSDPAAIETNVVAVAKAAMAFQIPVILSTVAVEMGVNQPTIESLQGALPGVVPIDRTGMNAWEDPVFVEAIKATGRRRLVFGALYTEICLAYPVLEALQDGYEASFIADAVGGESKVEHEMAILRMIQAGAAPNTTIAMIAEWFRDWKSLRAQAGREVLIPLFKARRQAESESMPVAPKDTTLGTPAPH